jgi:ABC-2 type transport system permease protein
MLLGIAYGGLYLVFAVATVAAVAALVRGVLAAAGIAVTILLVLAVVGNIGSAGRWLPTSLVGALDALARNADPVDYLPAAAIAFAASAALVWFAAAVGARREL